MLDAGRLLAACTVAGVVVIGLAEASQAPSPAPASGGAKTFISAEWHLAVDYPADWSADEDSDEVWFRSEKGEGVRLWRYSTDTPSEPARTGRAQAMQCSENTNRHGVTAKVCVAPLTSTYRADFLLKGGKSGDWRLLLETHARDPKVFNAMVASLRPDR